MIGAGESFLIIGNPTNEIILDGNGTTSDHRLFAVEAGATLTLEDVTLRNGVAQGGSSFSGGGAAGMGGAIFNEGTLNLIQSTLSGNTATGGAGGVGTYTGGGGLGGSGDVLGNGGGPNGGMYGGGNAGFGGGGGSGYNPVTVATYPGGNGGFGGGGGYTTGVGSYGGFGGGGGGGSAAGANQGYGGGQGAPFGSGGTYYGGGGAGMGGAIFNAAGTVTITNSTLAGNTAQGGDGAVGSGNGSGLGGAVFNLNGSLNLVNDTLADNTVAAGSGGVGGSAAGGALFALGQDGVGLGSQATAQVLAINTIFADTTAGNSDIVNTGSSFTGSSNNLTTQGTGLPTGVSQPTMPLNLGSPTTANGGPTASIALGTGSSAIDAGLDTTQAPYNLTTDQRGSGFVRKSGTAVDIGAYEVQQTPSSPTLTVSTNSLPLGTTTAGTPSTPQSYTVGGSSLTASISINAPSGVQLSLDQTTWATSETLSPTSGTVATTPIYVRINTTTAGSISGHITNTSSGATEQDVSASGTVTPTTANGYRISAASATPMAGANDQLTITLVDPYGNAETGFSGTKSLTFSGLSTSMEGNVPTVTNTTGSTVNQGTSEVITFASGVSSAANSAAVLVAYTAETKTLNVTDSATLSSTNTGGTGQCLTVSTAAASKLAITTEPSSTATTGVAFATQPVVAEEDTFGNVITTDSTHTVTAARGSVGTGTLQGSNLTVTLSSGVATFSGLSYNVAETMNIAFSTNAGAFTATSNNVVVSGAAGTVVSTQIDDGTAQRSMVRSITLTFSSSIASTLSTVLANLSLTRASDNLSVGLRGSLDSTGKVLTLTFTGSSIIGGSLADGRYTLVYGGTTLLGAGTAGQTDETKYLWRLFGDLNGTASVNAADLTAFNKAYNSRKGMSNYSVYFDYNEDGVIVNADQTAFTQHYGTSI